MDQDGEVAETKSLGNISKEELDDDTPLLWEVRR